MKPQAIRILRHLQTKGSITSKEAEEMFACTRLASRINELRSNGYLIETEMTHGKNKFGEPVVYATYVYMGGGEDADSY